MAYHLYVLLFYFSVWNFHVLRKMSFARGTLRNVTGVWCADLRPGGHLLGVCPCCPRSLAAAFLDGTDLVSAQVHLPHCLSAVGTEVLVPGPGPPEEPGKVGGGVCAGYGPIVAVLEKGTKECSEEHPQKDKQ